MCWGNETICNDGSWWWADEWKGGWVGGYVTLRRGSRPAWSRGACWFLCMHVCLNGGVDTALMSDNTELRLSRLDRSEMNSCYELWLCRWGIQRHQAERITHTETHPHTEPNVPVHPSESALRETKADFASTLPLFKFMGNRERAEQT